MIKYKNLNNFVNFFRGKLKHDKENLQIFKKNSIFIKNHLVSNKKSK